MNAWLPPLFCALPLSVIGQITLTSSDLPQPGVVYPLVDIAPPVLADLEIAGPNAVWDFSAVIDLNDAPQTPQPMSSASATALFVFNNPFNSSYQCDFFLPTELPDVGFDLSGIIPVDGFSNFYKTDGDAYTIAGLALGAAGFDVPVPYTDRDELFPLPLSAEMTYSSTNALAMDIPETFGYWSDGTRDVVVDGWGTLVLPDGEHDVLRVRTEIFAHDSIYIPQIGTPFAFDRTQVVYQWWGQGHGFPLLEVTSLFGVPATSRYLNLSVEPSSVTETSSRQLTAYPNPAQCSAPVRIDAPQGAVVEWFDARGQLTSSHLFQGLTVEAPGRPGIYVLRCGQSATRFVVY